VDLECGSYFITSHIYMPCIYHLYPETDLDCPCYGECETDLIAGQDWDSPAGVVTIWNDDVNLYVTFETTGGWELGETHLYVGATPPKKSAPGKFPYTDQTEYTIPLSDFPDVCILYIAAHAVVSQGDQEETAWADTYGITFGKSWAMFVMYNVCEGGCLEVQAAVENADTLRIVDELGCPLD
jgi:hypothetical protein